jgi:hypothetical protein
MLNLLAYLIYKVNQWLESLKNTVPTLVKNNFKILTKQISVKNYSGYDCYYTFIIGKPLKIPSTNGSSFTSYYCTIQTRTQVTDGWSGAEVESQSCVASISTLCPETRQHYAPVTLQNRLLGSTYLVSRFTDLNTCFSVDIYRQNTTSTISGVFIVYIAT